MKFPPFSALFVIGVCALSISHACAEGTVAPLQPRIFLPGELTPSRYTIVQRLWVGPWRSAISIPTREDGAAAIGDLLAEARKLGADGIINLICLNDRRKSSSGKNAFFCYGDAVKLK